MSGRMDWWRAQKLYSRRAVDHRFEHDVPDRAERWLRVAENRQRERRTIAPRMNNMNNMKNMNKPSDWITVASSAEVPW